MPNSFSSGILFNFRAKCVLNGWLNEKEEPGNILENGLVKNILEIMNKNPIKMDPLLDFF